jgi:hypothetical protein
VGVETTIQVVSQYFSGCLSFWIGESKLSNGNWAQIGYYLCGSSTPIAFYQIWNIPQNSVLTTGTTSVTTGNHVFSMYVTSGTTWAFALDGVVFGTYDMGSVQTTSTYPVQAFSEEGSVTSPQPFSQVEFATTMNVLRSGSWQPVSKAASYGTAWGVEGDSQDSLLHPDQTLVGGSLQSIASGTNLWNSIPLTDTISITSPTTGSTVAGTTNVIVNALSSVGILRVKLYVDGSYYGADATPPYSFSLDTTKYADGPHTLYAVLDDNSGGSATSSTVSLNVANKVIGTASITVNSVDQNGNAIFGYYTALWQNGNVKATGFTMKTFSATSGQIYSVEADSYGSCSFAHWSDGIASDPRAFTATSGSLSFTAVYSCGTSTASSTIDVSTANSAGSRMSGYYITLWQNGAQIQSCFSACSFTVNNGQRYQVMAASYGSETFNHWANDGSTGSETVNVPNTSTTISLTAVYKP